MHKFYEIFLVNFFMLCNIILFFKIILIIFVQALHSTNIYNNILNLLILYDTNINDIIIKNKYSIF